MKGAALELAAQGIRVNCIEPGMISTNLTSSIPEEEISKDVGRYPLGRYGFRRRSHMPRYTFFQMLPNG